MVDPRALTNRALLGVAAGWYVATHTADKALIHVWLKVDGLGYLKCHSLSGVQLSIEAPYSGYEMEELDSRVQVQRGGPASLSAIVGATITDVSDLEQDSVVVGFVLHTTQGSVAIADIGDDLWVAAWPDESRWEPAGVVIKR
jgi:hypothetical protein